MRQALVAVIRVIISFSVLFAVNESFAAVDVKAELSIIKITPEGEDVAPGRQVIINFNRPAVPLGRMERAKDELPIDIIPEVNCDWRWINTSTLACTLDEKAAFKPATKYEVIVKPGIQAEDGSTIKEPYKHWFITQRPAIDYTYFKEWLSPGTPVQEVIFNQPVTKGALEKHLYFKSSSGQRFAATVEADPNDKQTPITAQAKKEISWMDFVSGLFGKSHVEGRRIWLVSPKEELPLDSTIELRVEPGLISTLGLELGVENREIAKLQTFADFKFLGIRCVTNNNEDILITLTNPQLEKKLCNPLAPISLSFNTPVFRQQIKKYFRSKPEIEIQKEKDIWKSTDVQYSRLTYAKQDNYNICMPSFFKAAQEYEINMDANTIEDEFGRKLSTPIKINIRTDHRKPNFEIIHKKAVIEKNIENDVPLYVNNLDKAEFKYRSINTEGDKQNQTFSYEIPKVVDKQFAIPFGLRDMLGGSSGAVYGKLNFTPKIATSEGQNTLFAQVTPYQLYIKLGHFNTLVWVTDLTTGEVIDNAKVTIYKDTLTNLSSPNKILATAITDKYGIAVLPGREKIDPKTDLTNRWKSDKDEMLFVRVDKDKDMALMPISQDFSIDTWRASDGEIYPYYKEKYGHLKAWGTTAQGVYKTGDTIQYKFYIRNQDARSLTAAPRSKYHLKIMDPTYKVIHELKDITLSEFGSFSGEFKIPDKAIVGWYQFELTADFDYAKKTSDYPFTWHPMRVLVSDFTPSPFQVKNQANGDLFKKEQNVEVYTSAKLHSGGAYNNAATRVTAILESRTFTSKHPIAKNFTFGSYMENDNSKELYQKIDKLDNKGEIKSKFSIPRLNILYGKLIVESVVQDDRGKNIAAVTQADYIGADRFVGLKTPQWLYNAKKPSVLNYIVVDEQGKPVKGTKVEIKIERQITVAARIKGAGNAYLTNYTTNWQNESSCKGISEETPLECAFTPPAEGSYRAIGIIEDTAGTVQKTELGFWVAGEDYVLWDTNSDSYIQIIPEKEEYQIGEMARYLVKNPYPGAKALITVERYGVIEHFVQTFKNSTQVVEVPIKPDHLPGFYLSVVIFSPRVDKPLGNEKVDLGKPTFKIGYIKARVRDKYKEMLVTLKTDKETYRPKDKVKLSIHAVPGFKPPTLEPIEVAVAVLDESVFSLIAGGKKYFDPYEGFYKLEDLDLANYSLLTRLIGRQKFEKKGANPGGDGGNNLGIRSDFKSLSYWNPSLKTDGQGNANIEFQVPDNLTGWKILALAVTPTDRLGIGEASFKVNRPTEILPALPNQVTEGDYFTAGFTVLNRTDKKRIININVKAVGDIDVSKTHDSYNEKVTLEPYQRTNIWMPIQTILLKPTKAQEKGKIKFNITASDNTDQDSLEHTLPINKKRSLETVANYGTTVSNQVEESLLFPKDIYSDTGSIDILLAPSIIGNIEGAFKYLRDYPYTCWEQILTKGVMASYYKELRPYLSSDFTWKNSEGIPQTTLNFAANFQAPNGGMAFFLAEDKYVSPYLSAYTALAFNWLKQNGYEIPTAVESKLHNYLINLLKRDMNSDEYSEEMSYTIRAIILSALAVHGKIDQEDLVRYKPHIQKMSLFGKAHFIQAATTIPGNEAIIADINKAVLSHSNQTGDKFIFSEQLDSGYARILSSPLRENCAILNAFTSLVKNNYNDKAIEDIPYKLVNTITQSRKSRDHWENTQENMFCMNALYNYSKVYENVKPDMSVKTSVGDKVLGRVKFHDINDPTVTLGRNIDATDLGRKEKVVIEKEGKGRLYYATKLNYALLDSGLGPKNAGIEVSREYSVERGGKWVLLENLEEVKRGELIRVDIFLSLPSVRTFVVVNDPVPGGLEPINRDLATASILDIAKGEYKAAEGSIWFNFKDWVGYNVSRWSFYHQELRHDAVRFYSEYLPAGNYHLSYTAQVIGEGKFFAMPTHAEEMYNPEVFGKGKSLSLNVKNQ